MIKFVYQKLVTYSKLKYLHPSTLKFHPFHRRVPEYICQFVIVENVIVSRRLSSYFFAVFRIKGKKRTDFCL